jgi:3-dehydroquinate synthase
MIEESVRALGDLKEAFVVVDSEVIRLHSEALLPITSQFPTFVAVANEETKSLVGVTALVDWLIKGNAVRSSTLIAVGGGCIQDLVSFTSHIYYRGIDWVYLPTTVLSQSDSCIGAKSGINILPFKNQLGALHAPREVCIAAEFLATLSELEIQSGYGEILKLSVTSSRYFFGFLETSLRQHGLDSPDLLKLERLSLLAKQEIIESDELETDLRRVLNYGHSFGHALEALSGHDVPHGIAVLWGIDMINALGVVWGITPEPLAHRISELTRRSFHYRVPLAPSAEDLVDMLRRDKKVDSGHINFAVLSEPGNLVLEPRPLDDRLLAEVRQVLAGNRVFSSD